jgi:hypothetical protein
MNMVNARWRVLVAIAAGAMPALARQEPGLMCPR